MKIGGMLSEGIALGHRTGFDSGSTLDYVYRNDARGHRVDRPPDRPQLSRFDRLARHPPTQAASRGIAARRDAAPARQGDAGARDRYRGRPRPLCARGARRRSGEAGLDPAARLQRHQCRGRREADRRKRPRAASRVSSRAMRSTATASPRHRARADARRRLRPLRAVPRQHDGRAARSPVLRRRSRRAAIWSTPASPGIRSSN